MPPHEERSLLRIAIIFRVATKEQIHAFLPAITPKGVLLKSTRWRYDITGCESLSMYMLHHLTRFTLAQHPDRVKRGHCLSHRVHRAFSCHSPFAKQMELMSGFSPSSPHERTPYEWRFSRWLQMLWLRLKTVPLPSFPMLRFCESVK